MTRLGPLRVVVEAPRAAALLSDFDGTLAPIVPRAEQAAALPEVPSLLGRLARRLAVVGVVSGRPIEFLREALADIGDVVHLAGLYGMVWFDGQRVRLHPEVVPWLEVVAQVAAEAQAVAPAGVVVEPKTAGADVVSVTLHWRQAPDRAGWCQQAAEAWASATGLAVQGARMAVELRPPVSADKGTAVSALASGCTTVVYAGDDLGDLRAFDVLDELAAEGVATVRVAVADDETPASLISRADLVLDGPSAFASVLAALADALEAPVGPPG